MRYVVIAFWWGLLLSLHALPTFSQTMYAGGSGDGWARGGFAQPVNTVGVYNGGGGDGWARSGFAQPITTAGVHNGGSGDGWARSGFAQAVSSAGVFSGGPGDGYARNGIAQLISTAGVFAGGIGDGWSSGGAAQPINTAGIFSGGLGDGYASNYGTNVKVSIQGLAILEGPYSSGTQLMNDNLRSAGLVPLAEPYTALGYPNTPGSGGESTTVGTLAITGAGAVVDWVRVELRDANAPSTLLAVRHALLVRSGAMVDPATGDDFIQLNASPGNYYIVVRHRNHLGVMTAAPVALTSVATEVDFSLSSTATFGSDAQKTIGQDNVLWAGDVNGDHALKYTGTNNDRDPILVAVGGTVPTSTVTGQYRLEDVNMDGTIKYTGTSNDRDPILVNIGGTVPTNVRTEQVP